MDDLLNILFVFIDDMGYGDFGCYGNCDVKILYLDWFVE